MATSAEKELPRQADGCIKKWSVEKCPAKGCTPQSWKKLKYCQSYISLDKCVGVLRHHLIHSEHHYMSDDDANDAVATASVWEEECGEDGWPLENVGENVPRTVVTQAV